MLRVQWLDISKSSDSRMKESGYRGGGGGGGGAAKRSGTRRWRSLQQRQGGGGAIRGLPALVEELIYLCQHFHPPDSHLWDLAHQVVNREAPVQFHWRHTCTGGGGGGYTVQCHHLYNNTHVKG